MWPLIFILIIFGVVLFSSRRLQLGYSLLIGAVLLGLLFRMGWASFGSSVWSVLIDRETLNLLSVIFLVLILSETLRSSGQLERLVSASMNILHDLRLTVFFLPALIGMLPMPGGAYFSAPMVDSVLKDTNFSKEKKVFVNYWFRHVWEYILPLYPGIVALVSLTGLDFRKVASVNILLVISVIAAGMLVVFGRGGSPLRKETRSSDFKSIKKFLREISPIGLVLILVIFLKVPISSSLGLGICSGFLMNHFKWQSILNTFRKAVSWNMFIMVMGIVIFKGVLSDCGAVGGIASFMEHHNIGACPVIFGISFLSGLVTGITIGFVGISMPIILPIVGEPTPWNMMFVFACGFGGVLLSPVHLCLILTCDYFKANMARVYRYLIPPTLIMMAVGFAGYFYSVR